MGSFQHAYGIDLTDPSCDMHWHRFLALFRSLPDDSMMSRIMAYRTWEKGSKDSYERRMQKAKSSWALPPKETYETRGIIEWQKKAFGKIKP